MRENHNVGHNLKNTKATGRKKKLRDGGFFSVPISRLYKIPRGRKTFWDRNLFLVRHG